MSGVCNLGKNFTKIFFAGAFGSYLNEHTALKPSSKIYLMPKAREYIPV